MRIISGNSNVKLSKEIAKHLDIELIGADIKKFLDQEIWVEIKENVRGEDCFIIQSTNFPANDNLMELLVTVDALKRGSAKSITAVIPYFGYARQDRKTGPRTPITAKLVAKMLETAGVDKVLTIDLHATQIQGFFDVPVDNLISMPVFAKDISERYDSTENVVFVSPDVGGAARARSIAKIFNKEIILVDKRRPEAGVSEVMNIVGDVNGKHCIIVDDIADSAGTLCNAADALIARGALSVKAYITHGVLSGNAFSKIDNSSLCEIVVTDSIYHSDNPNISEKYRTVSVSKLLGEAIKRTVDHGSISELFEVKI